MKKVIQRVRLKQIEKKLRTTFQEELENNSNNTDKFFFEKKCNNEVTTYEHLVSPGYLKLLNC